MWLIGQEVKTPPSHGGIRGSIPLLAVLRHRTLYDVFSLYGQKGRGVCQGEKNTSRRRKRWLCR